MSPVDETFAEPSAKDRAHLVVRMAIRAFGDGHQAADWLARPNTFFDGYSPLVLATTNTAGCARVCELLDSLAES